MMRKSDLMSKRRLQLWVKRIERTRRKAKNRCKNRKPRQSYQSHTVTPYKSRTANENTFTFKFPSDCRFFRDIDSLTEIINIIKSHFADNPGDKVLNLDLSKVKFFDVAAIIIILTLTNYLNGIGIRVFGRVPEDPRALEMLVESDFFSHVITKRNYSKNSKDRIVTSTLAGKKVIETEVNAVEIRKIVLHLTGLENNYYPLYNVIGEIQGNSVEHANFDFSKKNWFMSVHYEDSKCLIILADIGEGILNTMGLRFGQNLKKLVSGLSDSQTLLNLFKGKYQSSTREPNRNTGLPGIFDSVKQKQIGKIHVITNKACLELSDESKYDLRHNFPGTLYSIEITKDNISNE